MAKEIERKFLVTDTSYREIAESSQRIRQGYLSTVPGSTVRVRIADNQGFITVKGITRGATRSEWEYAIPESDAAEMLDECCPTAIDKTRYIIPFCGKIWEVDQFHGPLTGLTVAEVELSSEDESAPLPSFVGKEVTGDIRYYNSSLAEGIIPPTE